jgi:hypothetical protein
VNAWAEQATDAHLPSEACVRRFGDRCLLPAHDIGPHAVQIRPAVLFAGTMGRIA